jgi:PGM1 C-terminal domain/ATP-grasp domain
MRGANVPPSTPETSFEDLQRQFIARNAHRSALAPDAGTVIVLPSLSLSQDDLGRLTGIAHYEERLLFLLLALRQPEVRIIYLSSVPIDAAIIDYYLRLLPDPGDARARLSVVAAGDTSARPLTAKLLDRPDLLRRLQSLAREADNVWILPFNVTELERSFATRLQTPIYGPSPELALLGSKSGSRRVAKAAGVPVPDGVEDLRSLAALDRAATKLRRRRAGPCSLIVKLDDSFSGLGNATVDLAASPASIAGSPTSFSAGGESWSGFADKIARRGAVVEERLRQPGMTFPSVLGEIAPGGTFTVLATHDQVLGGPSGQVYVGCRFPAASGYRDAIQDSAEQVAKSLAAAGAIGVFGIDFMVVPSDDGDRAFLGEINLRLGGTTHPLGVTALATGGRYDRSSGHLLVGGRPRSYVATDNYRSDRLVGMTPAGVVELVDRGGLAFRPGDTSGVVLHLLGAVEQLGKLGFTCVAESAEEAASLYRRTLAALEGSDSTAAR